MQIFRFFLVEKFKLETVHNFQWIVQKISVKDHHSSPN